MKQLTEYMALIDSNSISEENLLEFWEANAQRFSDLAQHGLQILALAPTSAAPERIFFCSRNVLSK